MTVSTCQLGELCEIVMGQSPPSATYNMSGQGLPFFQGKADFGEIFPQTRVFCSKPVRVAERGDILISVRAPVGPTNLVREKCCIGRGLSALRPRSKIDQLFLLYFLRYYEPTLVHRGLGSTFEAINRDDLEDILTPVPLLSEQQRIAQQLTQADRLIRIRRYALQMCDEVLPGVFLEMFGAPNEKWPTTTIAELAERKPNAIRTGPFGSQLLHSEFTDSGIAVLGIDNAVNNRFEWGRRRYITPQKYEQLKRYTVFPGDVVITIMGTCGRCAVIPNNIPIAINTKHLCCMTLHQGRALPVFIHAAFLHHPRIRHQLGVAEKGAIMEGLNMGIIEELSLPLPPVSLQRKFGNVVERHERLRATQVEALRQADHLFQTLLHQAFSGQ